MRRNRVLASSIAVALAVFSIGTATAWFSDSASIRFEISAADDFDDVGKVWVCKLIGPADDPILKPGKNPIHVSAGSLDAQEGFSDAHPSYIVEHGDVVCVVPTVPRIESPAEAPIAPEPRAVDTAPDDATPPDPTTTTSTVAETTGSSTTSTSTTTSSVPPTTVTTTASTSTSSVPEDPTTTATTDPDIDE
ncbi:MAG TPA: hypothetical protein VFT85_05980 [Acidimicrobiia bacterium]|nr:hypothetical protein [Acidimicrobiia bacterium]